MKKKMKKNCEDQYNTPSYTSMSLYNSINTPSDTTSTTNMYNKDRFHVPKRKTSLEWHVPINVVNTVSWM
jgi:hypothetical protein